jgi:hypothetical protein
VSVDAPCQPVTPAAQGSGGVSDSAHGVDSNPELNNRSGWRSNSRERLDQRADIRVNAANRFRIMLINRASLSQTLDAITAAHFDGRTLAAVDRGRAARWIAGRQGLPGAYGGTFAGFPSERSRGVVLFTGERIASASARHILGEEASRALRQLRVRDSNVNQALERADDGLMRCLARAAEDPRHGNPGLYCCGKCSVGLWRNLLAGGLDRQAERLTSGALHLRSMRDGEHQWHRFPFWYTVLALNEMDSAEARSELKYAAPALEQAASRAAPASVYARRRHELAIRTLNGL